MIVSYFRKPNHSERAMKKIGHADGLSRLIPTKTEPLEDTVMAALRNEEDIRTVLCCTVRNLPVTLQEIKMKQ